LPEEFQNRSHVAVGAVGQVDYRIEGLVRGGICWIIFVPSGLAYDPDDLEHPGISQRGNSLRFFK